MKLARASERKNGITDEAAWRTFLLDAPRGVIVSAFGFTAEPRFVYVLDASTGVTVQKTQVTATPEVFEAKNDVVHLRGYDRDYTFTWR